MTPDEAIAKVMEYEARMQNALRGLLAPAKAAVNVLKDHGQHTSAAELAAQIFVCEEVEREALETLKTEGPALIEVLLRR